MIDPDMTKNPTLPVYMRLQNWLKGSPPFHLSIRLKLLLSFFLVIFLMASVNVALVILAMDYKGQYDILINNITTANQLNGYTKSAIDTATWDIVKGKVAFDDGTQYQILDDVTKTINQMSAATDSESGRQQLEVIRRTMATLRYYVDMLGSQMHAGSKYDDNVKTLDNIRGVSSVMEESLQDYMLFEINRTGQKYSETQASFSRWVLISIAVLTLVIFISILLAREISNSIYVPIKKLQNVTATITHEDLKPLLNSTNADELTELGLSFNIMTSRIRQLLEEKIKEQENLKKSEMRVLQAQINPHFLYNTLDTIIWLAETNQPGLVVDIVRALSNFFRVSLSRGKDWIKIRDEIEHVRSYLTIQKVRYRDILEYQIDVDDAILDSSILKLSLQPLVENALYHGIKNKRGGGSISVRGLQADPETVIFEVADTGIGVPPEKLIQIQRALKNENDSVEIGDNGYGIFNVHKRIELYYGKQYGLTMDSKYQQGTLVKMRLPFERVES
jgi:two-component system, sensor histidine kinase YesM